MVARGRFVHRAIQAGDGGGAEAQCGQVYAGAADFAERQGGGRGHGLTGYCAGGKTSECEPPSTCRTVPVVAPASGLAR